MAVRWRQWTTVTVVALLAVAIVGCSTLSSSDGPGDPEMLQQTAESFHSDLRWARYDNARELVHEAYLGTFDGMFEERGDDYEIMDMQLKRLELRDDEGFEALVQVEQEWMQLPSTTVESERFMERWVFDEERWLLRERMERSDYRDQGDQFDSELDDDDEVGVDDGELSRR